jgi:DNA-binding MarR family transcriptional regulator
MNNDDQFHRLQQTFARLVDKYNSMLKSPMDYGTGDLLYPSEMDALRLVGRSPGIAVTDLAGALGVTKGAASQTTTKLVKKGLIRKSRDPRNMKRTRMHLTEKGELAFQYYERFQAIYDAHIRKKMERLTPKELAFLQTWFRKMEATIDSYVEALG